MQHKQVMQHATSTYVCPAPHAAPPLHTLDEWITSKHGNPCWNEEEFPDLGMASMKITTTEEGDVDKTFPCLPAELPKRESVERAAKQKKIYNFKNPEVAQSTETNAEKEKRRCNTKYVQHQNYQRNLKLFICQEYEKGNFIPHFQFESAKATIAWMRQTNYKNINAVMLKDFRARYLVENWHIYDPMEIFNYGWFYLLKDDACKIYGECFNKALEMNNIPIKMQFVY